MENKFKTTLQIKMISLVIAAAAVIADQITKMLAVTFIKPYDTISLIKLGETEFLNFTYCENTGMSFSLLEGKRVFLIAVPVLLIAAVEWYIFSGKAKSLRYIVSLSFLAGGGIGNLIDRVFRENGAVVDFIDFRIINFAIFNVADICAVLGGIFFAVFMIIDDHKAEAEKKREEQAADENT